MSRLVVVEEFKASGGGKELWLNELNPLDSEEDQVGAGKEKRIG